MVGASNMYDLRDVRESDGDGLTDVLSEIFKAGKRQTAGGKDFVRERYIQDPQRIRCTVAVNLDGRILGFQFLKEAEKNNLYGTPVGWGVIGTHIRPSAARMGIGRKLFACSLEAARTHGLPAIDATIGAGNTEGLAYYEAMGFWTYRTQDGSVSKVYRINR